MRGWRSMTMTGCSSLGHTHHEHNKFIIDPEIDEIDLPPEIHSDVLEDQVSESWQSLLMVS